MIAIDVLGTPAPKGSSRAILARGRGRPRAVLVPGGSDVNKAALKAWDIAVSAAAAIRLGNVGWPRFVDAALTVTVVFRIARPDGHWRKGKYGESLKPSAPAFPATKPDVDKLARSTLDALTGIVWDDDSRIVCLSVAKVYAQPGQEGACITVRERAVGDADWLTAEVA